MQLFQMTILFLWFLTYFLEFPVFVRGQSVNWYNLQRPNPCPLRLMQHCHPFMLGNLDALRRFSHFRGKHPRNYEDTLSKVWALLCMQVNPVAVELPAHPEL